MRVLGLLSVAAVALAAVQLVSPSVLAQDAAAPDDEGTLIQIGPDGGVRVEVEGDRRDRRRRVRQPGFAEAAPVSRYWIGVGGGTLPPELRAQLDIEPEEGVLIRTVAPDGPAAEAGLKAYDVVLRANGKPISNLAQLADEVGEQGELSGKITIDLLRRGKPETVWVTPIERPADAMVVGPRPRQLGRRREGLLGPDGVFGGGRGLEGFGFGDGQLGDLTEVIPQMATGVSVSVSRQDDGPARVTVKQNDKTWEFDEGDQDAINALPPSVRGMVERMLDRNGGVLPPGFEGFGLDAPGFQLQLEGELGRRLQAMQERLQAMNQRQFGDAAGDQMIEPQIELDEAPAFGAAPADQSEAPEAEVEIEEPVEIEIPATE